MEFEHNSQEINNPEVNKLVAGALALGEKADINWKEVVILERSALNLWFRQPELRGLIHHNFSHALAELEEISPQHKRAVEAVIMLHRVAMHPNTAYGLIDDVVKESSRFGFAGNLTRQDIESLLQIVQQPDT